MIAGLQRDIDGGALRLLSGQIRRVLRHGGFPPSDEPRCRRYVHPSRQPLPPSDWERFALSWRLPAPKRLASIFHGVSKECPLLWTILETKTPSLLARDVFRGRKRTVRDIDLLIPVPFNPPLHLLPTLFPQSNSAAMIKDCLRRLSYQQHPRLGNPSAAAFLES